MKRVAAVMALLLLSGCVSQEPVAPAHTSPQMAYPDMAATSSGVVYEGGDGSSMEQAVIIKAPNHAAGVRAEYNWIRNNHPGWEMYRQALMHNKGKDYDRIDHTTPEGETNTIYFDITDFFSKL